MEYDIYFLNEVSYEALRATTGLLIKVDPSTQGSKNSMDQLLYRWQKLRLTLDESKNIVKIYCSEVKGAPFSGGKDMPLGYLSEDDSKKYVPYLRKGWCNDGTDLYEGCVIGINENSQNPAQRIQVAIRIRESQKIV